MAKRSKDQPCLFPDTGKCGKRHGYRHGCRGEHCVEAASSYKIQRRQMQAKWNNFDGEPRIGPVCDETNEDGYQCLLDRNHTRPHATVKFDGSVVRW